MLRCISPQLITAIVLSTLYSKGNYPHFKYAIYILAYISANPMRCLCSTQLCNKASVWSLQGRVLLIAIFILVYIAQSLSMNQHVEGTKSGLFMMTKPGLFMMTTFGNNIFKSSSAVFFHIFTKCK